MERVRLTVAQNLSTLPQPPDTRLGRDEPVGPGLKRVSIGLLDYAIAGLRSDAVLPETAVHEARKALKHVRAVLRLVRDHTGREIYRAENVVLRDMGRRLAPARDATVLVHTLGRVLEGFGELVPVDRLGPLSLELERRRRAALAAIVGDRDQMSSILVTLGSARARFRSWPDEPWPSDRRMPIPDSFECLGQGLGRTYARGRRAHRMVGAGGAAGDFHEWRKRVKYLRHQLETIEGAWPALLAPTVHELHGLGEVLGEEHDLAVLRDTVARDDRVATGDHRRFTVGLIDQLRRELQETAHPMGARLYAEHPSAFVTRIGRYWDAWRS